MKPRSFPHEAAPGGTGGSRPDGAGEALPAVEVTEMTRCTAAPCAYCITERRNRVWLDSLDELFLFGPWRPEEEW